MTTSTHKRKANKFLLVLVFLLTFFLVYWYGHPQLIQQKWQDLTFEVKRIIKGQDDMDVLMDALKGLSDDPPSSQDND